MSRMRTKTTVVHLPNELHKQLKIYANRNGMKMEAVAKQAVESFLQGRK